MEAVVGTIPGGIGEKRLVAEVELVGDWMLDVEELEAGLCLPMRMFSTVKLEIVLFVGGFCPPVVTSGPVLLQIMEALEDTTSSCKAEIPWDASIELS